MAFAEALTSPRTCRGTRVSKPLGLFLCRRHVAFVHRCNRPHRKSSQILGNRCQQELISCAAAPAQAESIEFQHPLEVSEQDLYFLTGLA